MRKAEKITEIFGRNKMSNPSPDLSFDPVVNRFRRKAFGDQNAPFIPNKIGIEDCRL